MNDSNSETMEYPTRAQVLAEELCAKPRVSSVNESVEDTAYGTEIRREAAQVDKAGKYEPKLTENGIPSDVLAKLLPGDDVVELSEPVVGGTVAYRFVKRAFDIVSCGCALIILAIPMGVIALKIKSESPGPVIYAQRRVGKGEKVFNVYKFRSMYTDAEARGAQWAQGDDPRVTPFGKWMRDHRVDELPQFWNVIRGDIPLRILKTRPEFSEESMGAFALPAKSSTNKKKVFSQATSCFASGLRMRRISWFNCKRVGSMEGRFLAKPVFRAVCA